MRRNGFPWQCFAWRAALVKLDRRGDAAVGRALCIREVRALLRRNHVVEVLFGHHAIAPVTLGAVERAVAALEQALGGFAKTEFGDADRNGNRGDLFAGGPPANAPFGDGAADA